MPALKKGHKEALEWLGSPKPKALVAAYENVGGRCCVFPRITDKGLYLMSLSEHVPSFVGVQTSNQDKGHIIHPRGTVPAGWKVMARWCAHEDWLQKVKKKVPAEQATARWIRGRLEAKLALPMLGEGWLLFQHRWQFGGTKKAPIQAELVAIHGGTGQLGMVTADDASAAALPEHWAKTSKELAPFFTTAMRNIAPLYGVSIADALEVQASDPALFAVAMTDAGLTFG